MAEKRIIIVAGPNGAGKTTFAREHLPQEADCPTFVNADLIAEGLSPFGPDVAAIRSGRVMLSDGYHVALLFLSLPSPEDAINRVAELVRQGGHDVPEHVIQRLFASGWTNFREVYRHEVDEWFLYDNSGSVPVLIERGTKE